MQLTIHPQVPSGLGPRIETVLSVSGDVLTCDGVPFELSSVPEGGRATPPKKDDHPFAGPITRVDGEIRASVRVMLGEDALHDQPRDPAYWLVTVTEGAVAIPALRLPEPEGVPE